MKQEALLRVLFAVLDALNTSSDVTMQRNTFQLTVWLLLQNPDLRANFVDNLKKLTTHSKEYSTYIKSCYQEFERSSIIQIKNTLVLSGADFDWELLKKDWSIMNSTLSFLNGAIKSDTVPFSMDELKATAAITLFELQTEQFTLSNLFQKMDLGSDPSKVLIEILIHSSKEHSPLRKQALVELNHSKDWLTKKYNEAPYYGLSVIERLMISPQTIAWLQEEKIIDTIVVNMFLQTAINSEHLEPLKLFFRIKWQQLGFDVALVSQALILLEKNDQLLISNCRATPNKNTFSLVRIPIPNCHALKLMYYCI